MKIVQVARRRQEVTMTSLPLVRRRAGPGTGLGCDYPAPLSMLFVMQIRPRVDPVTHVRAKHRPRTLWDVNTTYRHQALSTSRTPALGVP